MQKQNNNEQAILLAKFQTFKKNILQSKRYIDELMCFSKPPTDLQIILNHFISFMKIPNPNKLPAYKCIIVQKMETLEKVKALSIHNFDTQQNYKQLNEIFAGLGFDYQRMKSINTLGSYIYEYMFLIKQYLVLKHQKK